MTLQLTGNDWHSSPLRTFSRGDNNLLSWSPYGTTAPRSGSTLSLPGFNGERQDPFSGVSHLGNGYRAYSPALRRFTSPDSESPFGVGGINAYAYCNADPVNQTDPSGHGPVTWLLRMAIRAGVRIGLSEALADGMATTLATAGKIETGLELASSAATGIAGASLAGSNPQLAAKLGWASMGLGLAGGLDDAIAMGARVRRGMKGLSGRIDRLKKEGLGGKGSKMAGRRMAHERNQHPSLVDRVLNDIGETRESLRGRYPSEKPEEFYRGDNHELSRPDPHGDLDERMVSALRHSSRQGGSAGEIQSFSSNRGLARRFARARRGTVHTVSASEGTFMSTADIILNHSERLVNEGKILPGTVRRAIEYLYESTEEEYFWLR
ncbi:RHS repeat-associated core domain-containing protein [Salmonella enterica subsp. enterica]|nr:RHS repeat-associated core domain-containing protein [Salmonella enterica subsp. enterica serovar Mikawasima]EDN7229196.1 RHS repeat-associated core domain-containing protein [Salmonella enterica subsp. enterica serovar Mikawasima]